MNNPWNDISDSSLKRIDVDLDLFWAKDHTGNYLLLIEFPGTKMSDISDISLTGLSIYVDTEKLPLKLFLSLNDKKDWEIFYQLSLDLINASRSCKEKEKIPNTILERLQKWQFFLKSIKQLEFPIIKQAGLFGELYFLKNTLIPALGHKRAIEAWVGPDKDKQDFRFNGVNVEVKTYLERNRGKVTISSVEQFCPTNGDLFLRAYGIKYTNEGKTIKQIADEIREDILPLSQNILDLFEKNLCSYGFFSFVNYTNLRSFEVFEDLTYYVRDGFPRIEQASKKEQIISIQYEIDLSKCSDFIIEELNVFKTNGGKQNDNNR